MQRVPEARGLQEHFRNRATRDPGTVLARDTEKDHPARPRGAMRENRVPPGQLTPGRPAGQGPRSRFRNSGTNA